MAQNCLTPNGPPKFETVKVPPCIYDYLEVHLKCHNTINQPSIGHLLEVTKLPHSLQVSGCYLWPFVLNV